LALHVAGAFEHVFAVVTALLTTIAVGFFALWSVLSNIVCALLILVFRPFQVGDRIEVLEGSAPYPQGKVLDLNLLFVTLEERTEEGTLVQVQVPNTLFFQKVVRRVMSGGQRSDSFFPKSSPVASAGDNEVGPSHT
jgi:small-conductance mechanosensitive channel